MGMTMTQKILARHVGRPFVEEGDLLVSQVDLVLANDITGPPAINVFNEIGVPVFDKDKIALVPDHFSPCKDIKSATLCKQMRDFARQHRITNYFEVGRMGIEHALLPNKGLVAPGEIIVGADSHTCTYGALNALSTGMGQTDIGCAMASGTAWFKVPAAIKVELTGKMPRYVKGKDLILTLIGLIGVDGARYQGLEFTGSGVHELDMSDRFTICNMAIEAGGKNGIFEVDQTTLDYVRQHSGRQPRVYKADPDASYEKTYEIDLSTIRPTVAFPHLPGNARTIDQVGDVKIDQVVIGSCTNGFYENLEEAASIIRGHKIAKGVRCIVIPATQAIYLKAMENGLLRDFVEAGCVVSTPTCGPCLGGYMGVLAPGEVCVSTTNRNFIGRMGDKSSKVYLASPAVAAASAIKGRIASFEEV